MIINMGTTIMIHRVLNIKVEIEKFEKPLIYVKNLTIKTEEGLFTISLFSKIEQNLISNRKLKF